MDAIAKKFNVIYHHADRNEDYFLQAGEFEPELVLEFKSFEFK